MKYSVNTWDYHGHHDINEFETDDEREALRRYKIADMRGYGDCTLYRCPNGWKSSCQTAKDAGYIEIVSNGK